MTDTNEAKRAQVKGKAKEHFKMAVLKGKAKSHFNSASGANESVAEKPRKKQDGEEKRDNTEESSKAKGQKAPAEFEAAMSDSAKKQRGEDIHKKSIAPKPSRDPSP